MNEQSLFLCENGIGKLGGGFRTIELSGTRTPAKKTREFWYEAFRLQHGCQHLGELGGAVVAEQAHSQPLVIQYISRLLPPTYFLELLKSLFLGGNNWNLIIKNSAVLLGFAVCFTMLTIYITRKKVE